MHGKNSAKSNFFDVVVVALITVKKIILMNKQTVTDKHFFWTKICYMVVTICTVDDCSLCFVHHQCQVSSGKLMPAISAYILEIYAYGCI